MRTTAEYLINVSAFGLPLVSLAALLLLCGVILLWLRFSRQSRLLAESHRQLQAVFKTMAEGVLILSRQGDIVALNEAASELLGLTVTKFEHGYLTEIFDVFLPSGEFVPPERWPSALAWRGTFVQNYEIKIFRKNAGKSLTVEVSTAPIYDEQGECRQIVVTYHDITKSVQGEESRDRLAAIVDSSEDAIIGKDPQGIVTSWNRGAEKIFGYKADEMIGESIRRLLPQDRLEEENDILRRIRRGELVDHIETVRRTKSGKFIHVSLTISPIRDGNGKVIGASKIARNISERKLLESQLFQSQKMEAIGQLTGGIAHDFNNLLGIIFGNLDLLERIVATDPVALQRVQTAQRAATRGADLTRRLLAFASREVLNPAPTDLEQAILGFVELISRPLGPEIRITTHFDPTVPEVFADPSGLEGALINLAINARDAMPKGGTLTIATQRLDVDETNPTVKTGELQVGSYACISVSDEGHGMSRETLDRVFEPFFTTKPTGKGTGLGLAMVYGYAKQSGGAVNIYSEVGYGTTVSIYLPLAKHERAAARHPAAFAAPIAKRSGYVLLVDDEPELLEIGMVYLQGMGYTAYQAKSGIEALEVIRTQPQIDLVVTDIIMPGGMNGVELADEVKKLRPEMRFVFTSGFSADAMAERSLPLFHETLLRKPYQRNDFGAAVRSALEA
jgi:PAS domain S-box-containing protein